MLLRSAVHALLAYAKNNPKSEVAHKSVLLYLDSSNCAHGSPHSSSIPYLTLPSNLLTLSQYHLCADKHCFSYKEIMGDSPLILQYLDRLHELKEVKYEITNIPYIERLLKDAEKILNELQNLTIKPSFLSESTLQAYKESFNLVATTHKGYLFSGFYRDEAYQSMAELIAIKENPLYLTLTKALGGEYFNLNGELEPHVIRNLNDLHFLKENFNTLNLPGYDSITSYHLDAPVRNLEEFKNRWQLEVLNIVDTLILALPNSIDGLLKSNNQYLARKMKLNANNSLPWGAFEASFSLSKDHLGEDCYTEIWLLNEVQARFLILCYGVSPLLYENNNTEDLSITNQLLLESETLHLNEALEIAKSI